MAEYKLENEYIYIYIIIYSNGTTRLAASASPSDMNAGGRWGKLSQNPMATGQVPYGSSKEVLNSDIKKAGRLPGDEKSVTFLGW